MAADPLREPPADLRKMSSVLFDLFNALSLAGFTETQALQIVGYHISIAYNQNQQGDQG